MKYRANLMLNEDVYKRAKAACETLDSTISAYVDDYLKTTLPILETAAKTNDFRAIGSAMGVEFANHLSQLIHTNEGGGKSKKVGRKLAKK